MKKGKISIIFYIGRTKHVLWILYFFLSLKQVIHVTFKTLFLNMQMVDNYARDKHNYRLISENMLT